MVVWSWVVSCLHCVKVTVRLAGSCKRMGRVDGHLQQWVKFAGEIYLKNYIFSLFCLNTFSVLMFVVKNKHFFKKNSDVHNFNPRSHYYLQITAANFAVFQKGVWYSGTKIYNPLPPTFKQLSYNISKFKAAFKSFLFTNTFYTLEGYYR